MPPRPAACDDRKSAFARSKVFDRVFAKCAKEHAKTDKTGHFSGVELCRVDSFICVLLCTFRSPNCFVLFVLQIFSGGVYPRAQPHAQSTFLFPIVLGVNFSAGPQCRHQQRESYHYRSAAAGWKTQWSNAQLIAAEADGVRRPRCRIFTVERGGQQKLDTAL